MDMGRRFALRFIEVTGASILVMVLGACRSGPIEGWSSRARTMILTSGPTEIGMSSSRIPGYWAEQPVDNAEAGQSFFLSTKDRSFRKGDRVRVEGPYGQAAPAVFLDDTGAYYDDYPTYVLVVWKIERYENGSRP